MDFNTLKELQNELKHEEKSDVRVKKLINKLNRILRNKSYITPSNNKHPKDDNDLLNPEEVRLDDLAGLFGYRSYL